MAKEEKNEGNGEEVLRLSGLVVDWTLPSRAVLTDWIPQLRDNEVRLKEVVELFPKDIFTELETIRRTFYLKMQHVVLQTYGLKLLGLDLVPKFKQVVDQTRLKLADLDVKIKKAVDSAYHQYAVEYMNGQQKRPRTLTGISKRFTISMIPLQIDQVLWDEFLTQEMHDKRVEISNRILAKRKKLEKSLEGLKKQVEENIVQLQSTEDEIERVFGNVNLAVKMGELKVEQTDRVAKIKKLKAEQRDLEKKVADLNWKQKAGLKRMDTAQGWIIDQTRETEKKISFDAKKLWSSQLETLVREVIEIINEQLRAGTPLQTAMKKMLNKSLKSAEVGLDRIQSLAPTSQIIAKYEELMTCIRETLNGKDLAKILKQLEEM